MDVEKLKELVEEGRTAREIAAAMGVSRQRVYQWANVHALRLAQDRRRFGPREPKVVARVITGGVEHPVSKGVSGRISEMLVAADLAARGWKVFFPLAGAGAHDLVASKGAALLSFEVRSATRNGLGRAQFAKDRSPRSDHYALVLRGEPVEYRPDLPNDVAPLPKPWERPS